MSTQDGWYPMQAKANPDLFRVIFDFNCRPQFWLHPEVVETLPHKEVVRALSGTLHGGHHLSQWLARELKLNDREVSWDFKETRQRLLLLSYPSLERLAQHAGAAACWPAVAATISRDQIRDLKAALGEAAHVFALRRGRMLVPEQEAVAPGKSEYLSAQALKLGWQAIATAAYSEHPELRKRFALKLPHNIAESIKDAPPPTPEARDKTWLRLRKICPEVLTEGELKCFA